MRRLADYGPFSFPYIAAARIKRFLNRGDEYAVAKKTELIMMKVGPSAGRIISAIEEIIRDIYDTVSWRPSKGWTVVQISGGFVAHPNVNNLALRLSSQVKFLSQKNGDSL